jgi:hypothetical protein
MDNINSLNLSDVHAVVKFILDNSYSIAKHSSCKLTKAQKDSLPPTFTLKTVTDYNNDYIYKVKAKDGKFYQAKIIFK